MYLNTICLFSVSPWFWTDVINSFTHLLNTLLWNAYCVQVLFALENQNSLKISLSEISNGSSACYWIFSIVRCFSLHNTQSCCLWQSSYLALPFFSPKGNHRFELFHPSYQYLGTAVRISLARYRGEIHGRRIGQRQLLLGPVLILCSNQLS